MANTVLSTEKVSNEFLLCTRNNPHGKLTGMNYIVDRFYQKLKQTRPHLAKSPISSIQCTSAFIWYRRCQIVRFALRIAAVSSVVTSTGDLFLSPDRKTRLVGKRLYSSTEVMVGIQDYFVEFDLNSYFIWGLKKWQERWGKCYAFS